jgi:methylenetetrahydrofolate dehydrogenase (NADP+)/methenyltetrahydrofolate cyclohydrolase
MAAERRGWTVSGREATVTTQTRRETASSGATPRVRTQVGQAGRGTGQVIDGRAIAGEFNAEVTREVRELYADGRAAGIATLLIGGDYAARAYERRIGAMAAELGVAWFQRRLPGDAGQQEVLAEIRRLNADPAVSGTLILRPAPPHISEEEIFTALDPAKDIEAVHPQNAGLLALGRPRYVPSTPAAVFHILDRWLDEAGEDRAEFYHRSLITVVGRSSNVGKPSVSLAYDRQAAVQSVDEWASRTGQLGLHTRRADVLIVAAGVPGLIGAEHVRQGAVVLDVGINRVTDPATGTGRLVGDVQFDAVAPRARAITPVPGGIGPVTDAWVIRNTVAAARNASMTQVPIRKGCSHDPRFSW